MATTLTEQSKELVSSLILKEFHDIDFSMDYIYNKSQKLINTANDLGLLDLAQQLTELKN